MSRMRLRLGLPTGSWIGDASRATPDATLHVTETIAADEGDVTVLSVAGTNREHAVAAIRDHERVERVDVVERLGSETALRVNGRQPPFVAAARRVGVPIGSTVVVTDGKAVLEITDKRDRLTAFGRRLTTEGVTVGIEAIKTDEENRMLTDAQRDLVLAAVDAGYYDTPRRCTLTELAAKRGIAKSTCSETLHRAEGQVLRRFVEGASPFEHDEFDTPNYMDGETIEVATTEP